MQYQVNIPARFNGPVGYANGGYICGIMANHFSWTAEFRLRKMTPCEQDLNLDVQAEDATLYAGQDTFIVAKAATLPALEVPKNPGFAAAQKASLTYLGHQHELAYNQCYVCSAHRSDDGMCVHTGRLGKSEYYAAPWVPQDYMKAEDGLVRPEFLYAALDCPGAYAAMGAEPENVLLGQFTVQLFGSIKAKDDCVLLAWCSGKDGRRRFAHTVLYGPNNTVVGRADAVWFLV